MGPAHETSLSERDPKLRDDIGFDKGSIPVDLSFFPLKTRNFWIPWFLRIFRGYFPTKPFHLIVFKDFP
jgi:hypothetical protein